LKPIVLVTGASRGIGRAIVKKFSELDYRIVVNSRNSDCKLDDLYKEISKINDNVLSVAADVSDYNQCIMMFDKIKKKFGPIEILINNAGVSYWGLFNEMQKDDWQKILQVNLGSVINCTHIAIQDMIKNKKGIVINISSVWGNIGASCEVIYSASKGAINTFTKALAKELGPCKININAIACGMIDTSMNKNFSCEERKNILQNIPLDRFGSPDDVANLVLFLTSNKAKYITGQIINLDGGWI
jgi:3-oxoacyl-[acyl-carrier protein] reductase